MSVFVPSPRKGGAQRMFCATVLTLEAFVVFFAVLAAHGLAYTTGQSRLMAWGLGLTLVLALLLSARKLSSAVGYQIGALLQIAVLAFGLVVPMMWGIGALFAIMYLAGLWQGHRIDAEKDEIDRRVLGGE
ncbi:DUF4233 domain-containing protein [Dermabacteraceae bacterium TAE3-ERU27]|nr:DUF4233 domain-containing protein [Dermabacteraceae bacterium TAE3-ERU27]